MGVSAIVSDKWRATSMFLFHSGKYKSWVLFVGERYCTECKIGLVVGWDNSGIQEGEREGRRYFQHACPWNAEWDILRKIGQECQLNSGFEETGDLY